MIRAYFRRGAHRANRFSVRVADIAAVVAHEAESRRLADLEYQGIIEIDGVQYFQIKCAHLRMARFEDDIPGMFIAAPAPTGRVALPALIDEVVADA